MKKLLIILPLAVVLAGCANLATTAFNTEKTVGDTSRATVHAFNQYYIAATNGATAAQLTKLNSERDQVYAASRKVAATLQATETLRLNYVANSADTNATALQVVLKSLSDSSAVLVPLAEGFMSGSFSELP